MYQHKHRIKAIVRNEEKGVSKKEECCYCELNLTGSIYSTVEHLLPKSKGGSDSERNLKRCCSGCNHMRGNMDLRKFYTHVQHLAFNNPNDQRLKKMVANIKWHIGYVEACIKALAD